MHILPILSDAYKHNLNLICEIQCFVPAAAPALLDVVVVFVVAANATTVGVEAVYRNLYYFALHKTNTSNSHLCSSRVAEVVPAAVAGA